MSRNVCDLFGILFWLYHISVSGLLKLDVKKLMQDSIGQGVGYAHLWYSSDVLAWDIYSEAWDVVIKFCCLSFVLLLCSRCSLADMPIQQLWIVSNHSTRSGHDFIILVFCGYIMNADVCTVPIMGAVLTFWICLFKGRKIRQWGIFCSIEQFNYVRFSVSESWSDKTSGYFTIKL